MTNDPTIPVPGQTLGQQVMMGTNPSHNKPEQTGYKPPAAAPKLGGWVSGPSTSSPPLSSAFKPSATQQPPSPQGMEDLPLPPVSAAPINPNTANPMTGPQLPTERNPQMPPLPLSAAFGK